MRSDSFTRSCPMNSGRRWGRSESSTTLSSGMISGVVISARDIGPPVSFVEQATSYGFWSVGARTSRAPLVAVIGDVVESRKLTSERRQWLQRELVGLLRLFGDECPVSYTHLRAHETR